MTNINYIKQHTKEITIKFSFEKTEKINIKFSKYIDSILINQLTTYKGRLDGIKNKYKFTKLVPIYIAYDLILFPINNQKDFEKIYINACAIKELIDKGNQTIIKFIDNSKIEVAKNINLISNYQRRSLSINHNS